MRPYHRVKRIVLALSTLLVIGVLSHIGRDASPVWLDTASLEEILLDKTPIDAERAQRKRYGTLRIEDVAAPYDSTTHTFYVPQNPDAAAWDGKLSWSNRLAKTYLVADAPIEKRDALARGTAFRLVTVIGGEYLENRLVFTGLPMLVLTNSDKAARLYTKTTVDGFEQGAEIHLFDPTGAPDGGYQVFTSGVRYRPRGNSSIEYEKSQYKLTLLRQNGKKWRVSLLNLPRVDALLLSAQQLNPTKYHPAAAIALWNQLSENAEPTRGNRLTGEYRQLELIEDNCYLGLYGNMVPYDSFIDMGDNGLALLAKAHTSIPFATFEPMIYPIAATVLKEDALQIKKGAPEDVAALTTLIDSFSEGSTDPYETLSEWLILENAIDYALYISAICGYDNAFLNFFYEGRITKGGDLRFTRIPWDLDMSFGKIYGKDRHTDNAHLVSTCILTPEILTLLSRAEDDTLWRAMCARWTELRETVFSDENVANCIHTAFGELWRSGALLRDRAIWTEYPNTLSDAASIDFARKRLAYLDGYFDPETPPTVTPVDYETYLSLQEVAHGLSSALP